MALLNAKSLRDVFHDKVRGAFFYFEELGFVFNKSSGHLFGRLHNMVMPKEDIFALLQGALSQGHLTQLNAASLLNSLALRHKHSRFNPVSYLKNHVGLYNAPLGDIDPVSEVAKIEKIKPGSKEWGYLKAAYENPMVQYVKGQSSPEEHRLQSVKIRAWALDLQATTGISILETENLIAEYRHPTAVSEEEKKNQPTTALPKEFFLPLLRALRNRKWFGIPMLSDTQAGIILCHLLHARETRNGGASYVTHPMAVANLCIKYAESFLPHDNEESLWVASCMALKHDMGEKSGFNVNEDLKGLHSDRVIRGVRALHKAEDDTYFGYLEKLANEDLVTAFVKLCDIVHNSSDNVESPSSKQAFVYLVAANYLKYRITNRHESLSVLEYLDSEVFFSEGLSLPFYQKVELIAESKDIKDADGKVIQKADKKKKAAEFPKLKDMVDELVKHGKLAPISRILQLEEKYNHHAYPRRDQISSVQP
jgi:hypothetical protein